MGSCYEKKPEPCVTGLADEGYEELKGLLTIDYCRDGEKIIGAVIGADEFRPDSPNAQQMSQRLYPFPF